MDAVACARASRGEQVTHERLERCTQRAERAEADAEIVRAQLSAMHSLVRAEGAANADEVAAELERAHAEIVRLTVQLTAPAESGERRADATLRAVAAEAAAQRDQSSQAMCSLQRLNDELQASAAPLRTHAPFRPPPRRAAAARYQGRCGVRCALCCEALAYSTQAKLSASADRSAIVREQVGGPPLRTALGACGPVPRRERAAATGTRTSVRGIAYEPLHSGALSAPHQR